jgi:hypothetical protein
MFLNLYVTSTDGMNKTGQELYIFVLLKVKESKKLVVFHYL